MRIIPFVVAQYFLGLFDTEAEAAAAFDECAPARCCNACFKCNTR